MVGDDTWVGLHADLMKELRLRTDPVAVTLLPSAATLVDDNRIKVLRQTAVCQLTALARYYREEGVVGASAEGIKCLWAAGCLGLVHPPTRLVEGDLNLAFTEDQSAARALQDAIFSFGEKRYSAIVAAPLDLAAFPPDAVVIYCTPGQAQKLLLGLCYEKGEVVRNPITAQVAVCQCIARAIATGEVCLEIPCMGDRSYGLVQDDELVIVLPAKKVAQVVEGMKLSDPFSAYPCRPFLRWSAIFPPEFEPTRRELE